MGNILEVHKQNHPSKLFIPEFHLPVTFTNSLEEIRRIKFDPKIISDVTIVPAVGKIPTKLAFQLNTKAFTEDVLTSSVVKASPSNKHFVIEFGSPNIAKPFHVGHLRSTIIGNFIGNLYQHLGHHVTKLNYLGDWGTQFGLLQIGVEMMELSDIQIQQNPIENLFKAYVTANIAAKSDEKITAKARTYFTNLENSSNPDIEKQWRSYRQYTVNDLERVYKRIGVHFDQYDWESQYSQKHIGDVIEKLQQRNLLIDEVDGRKVVQVDGRRVPVIKSDGSTLYLLRDIAALIDRFQRFKFEKIFYVVDNSQTDHFRACFSTTTALQDKISEDQLQHIKFGRIRGMSTRSGNVTFLHDLLDEARDMMYEKQQTSKSE